MIGALPEFIWSLAPDGVYVDLFVGSTLKYQAEKGSMALEMSTSFPYDQKVSIKISAENPLQSSIRIRIPSWCAGPVQVNVNGKKAANGKPGSYLTLSRTWKNGDEISFTVPMALKLTKYTGEEQDPVFDRYALEYGPLLMAYVSMEEQKDNIMLPVSPARLVKSLRPVTGKPLHFTVNEKTDFEYMPYFEVQEENFSCYPLAGLKN
jgi:DUF1680 family protein